MANAPLLKRSADGRTYLCAFDNAVLPDGTWLQGTWNQSTGAVTGVLAFVSGRKVVHSCGTFASGQPVGSTVSNKWAGQQSG